MNDFGIGNEKLTDLIEYFSSVKSIDKVIIFGSRARGDYKPHSDIDFAVYTKGKMKAVIRDVIQAIMGLYTVDVVEMQSLESKELILNIEKDGKVIYQS